MTIINAFQSILDKSKRKPNKIWVDQGSEFYNNVFKKWLKDNDIIMYSTHNEGKSVVNEKFIRTLKNKIYKHMTAGGFCENSASFIVMRYLIDFIDKAHAVHNSMRSAKLISSFFRP